MSKEKFIHEFINDVWNNKKFVKVKKYIHHDYTVYLDTGDPWEGKTLNHAGFKERLKFSFNSFPDMHFKITSTIEEENHVAINWILTGTNLGPISNFPPTKKSIKTNGMTIYYFRDSLISGHAQVFDRITVMKQLGFM